MLTCIIGPYYTNAKMATLIMWVVAFFTLIAIFLLNRYENNKRDREAAAGHQSGQQAEAGIEFHDLTDKENKLFRYVL